MPNPQIVNFIPGRIELRAKGVDTAELLIYGDIGESWLGQSVAAADVVRELATINASTIVVRINSYGGSVIDGLAIYNALKRHAARIEVTVDGLAASIASLIAMAGDSVEMPENAIMMIHAPYGGVFGNARDVEQYLPILHTMEASLASAYASKTGKSNDEMLALLRRYEDLYYTAEEAKAAGFCDRVTADERTTAQAEKAKAKVVSQPEFSRVFNNMPARIAASMAHAIPSEHPNRDPKMPNPSSDTEISAAQRTEVLAAERHRVAQIRDSIDNNPRLKQIGEQAIADGVRFEDFGQRALAALAEGAGPLNGNARVDTSVIASGRQPAGKEFVAAASDVLAARAGVKIENPHAGARDMRGMSIGEIARACLARSDRDSGLGGAAAIRAAMSTSDFPAILGDTMRKALRTGYESEPGTHAAWIRHSTVLDFKPQSRSILGSMPDLLKVPEGSEYPYGAVDEDKSVPFIVEKYGRIIAVTWEALVNDDLGALGRIPQGLGQAARRKEADLAYALFADDGQVMQDGVALFDADHGNLATSSATLDKEALAKGRLLLRKQNSLGGGVLNLVPRFLLVPPELESAAEEILAASSIHVSAGLENATPEWIRRLELVVESRLPADAAYLLAGNGQIDTAELAYLDEDNGPVVDEEEMFERDVKKFRVRFVLGARALDWRGFAKLPIA